ncbi:MAG: FKBP-type peptidyl-prolyl cis-trans isomerase [Elusimicrobiota bacterium]
MNRILALTMTFALGATPLFADEAPATPAAPAAKAAAKPAAKKAAPAATSTGFKTEDERTFYAYGYKIGQNLASSTSPSDAEAKAISQGLRDAITGKPEPEGLSLAVYLPKVGEMVSKRVAAKADAEKAKGRAYADQFAKEDGVKAIANGGFIKTLTEGTGAAPTADDTVKVHYRGTLINGTEFDSSYARKEPATFPLKNVIPCWTNGVAMMKVGGKAKLVCPSDVAYGDQGHPPTIPGGATLNFEVELLEIVKPEAPKDAAPAKGAKKN